MTRSLCSHWWKTRLLFVPPLILLLALAADESQAAPAPSSITSLPSCQQAALTVSFGLLHLLYAQVSGTLRSDGPLAGCTVQVLVSGATYGQTVVLGRQYMCLL